MPTAVAQQVPAAQHVLEEPEEDFDRPAVAVDQGDDLGRHVEQVGGDPQHAVAARPVEPPLYLPRLTCGVVLIVISRIGWSGRVRPTCFAEFDDRVFQDAGGPGFFRERAIFDDLVVAVVAQAADVAAALGDDRVEQCELGVAAVFDVTAARFECSL